MHYVCAAVFLLPLGTCLYNVEIQVAIVVRVSCHLFSVSLSLKVRLDVKKGIVSVFNHKVVD